MSFTPLDLVAMAWFNLAWTVYAIFLEFLPHRHEGLNARMNGFREVWMRRMLDREMRMVDMQVMAALQNGTAFFASTSLFAIGGALTLVRSTDEVLGVVALLPFGIKTSRTLWEIKAIGLVVIFVYAFFKFAWSYRLYNYVAILLGAMPPPAEKGLPETEAHIMRTTALFTSAGRHFNHGQRSFFFALGFLGWFISPYVFMGTTTAVVFVMWWRQFRSDASRAMDAA
jgi:uncharacterized membrane protein